MLEPIFFNQPHNRNLFTEQGGQKRQSHIDRSGKVPFALSCGLCSIDNQILSSGEFTFRIHFNLFGDVFEGSGKMGAFAGWIQEVGNNVNK